MVLYLSINPINVYNTGFICFKHSRAPFTRMIVKEYLPYLINKKKNSIFRYSEQNLAKFLVRKHLSWVHACIHLHNVVTAIVFISEKERYKGIKIKI